MIINLHGWTVLLCTVHAMISLLGLIGLGAMAQAREKGVGWQALGVSINIITMMVLYANIR